MSTLTGSLNTNVRMSVVKLRSNPVRIGPVISGIMFMACKALSSSIALIELLFVSVTKRDDNEIKVLLIAVAI